MAEAHQAVSYSTSLIHEHTDANHDQEVVQLVWKSFQRSLKKRSARFVTSIRNGVYPAHLESLWIIIGIVMGLHFATQYVPFDFVNYVVKFMPDSSTGWQTVACFLVGLLYWIIICLGMRNFLKFLLMYKGYMFETRGRQVSTLTKVWAVLVKVFLKWNKPLLYSFQGSLPRLSVPSIKDTMTRYLRSVRPLLDDATYEKVRKEADEFANGIGKKLQRYLILKSWWSSNYVSDWWEEYVYLKSPNPVIVNSNIYGTDFFKQVTTKQSARAANVTHLFCEYNERIKRHDLKPVMAQGMVPLCMWQCERLYNTTRVPGVNGDKLITAESSNHVVVMHKGSYYKMLTKLRGRMLKPIEMQYQFEQILNADVKPSHGEEFLAALTAWDRKNWAQVREKHFTSGQNRLSISEIETAAFIVVLEDEPYNFSIKSSPDELGAYGRKILHGKGNNIWLDKSFTLLVSTDGRIGVNGEHSLADAPALGYIYESICYRDIKSYDENGNCKGTRHIKPPVPSRLSWEFNEPLLKSIDEAYACARKLIDDVDHQILMHDAFGKGLIKTCRLSPDAFVQMALQLAYYRDQGKFALTYEASMTRLFLEGRTETVRSCTIESAAWAKAMEDKSVDLKERVRLLNVACNRHQVGYLDAMCGRGVDRHLFCLYVVSKYLEVESPFLKEVISEPWRLSTSQTPHGQSPKINLSKIPDLITGGGGFGPVSYDGYSVSYVISGEDMISFHVSSNKSCPTTSTDRFSTRIFQALNDVKNLFEELKALK